MEKYVDKIVPQVLIDIARIAGVQVVPYLIPDQFI